MSVTSSINSVLLYLNGIRVPCISVTVSCTDGNPATAGAQIPWSPVLEGLGEEDLVQAAIFYLDNYYYDSPQYCLLYEGRLVGYSYSNSPSGEVMALNFESNLMILNDLSVNFVGAKSGDTSTANKDYPNQLDVKTTASKLLTTKLNGSGIRRPFDIIENIIYATSGEFRDSEAPSRDLDSSMKNRVDELKNTYDKELDRLVAQKLPPGKSLSDLSDSEKEEIRNEVSEKLANQLYSRNGSSISKDRFYRNGQSSNTTISRYIAEQVNKEYKEKASNYRDVVMSGFFARHFRLLRFREHWVASPYLEGFPGEGKDPSMLSNGVFPLLKSKGAKKYFKSLVKRTGEKMGPQGRAMMLVRSLYSMMFYKIQELLAPPAYVSSKYSIPEKQLSDAFKDIRKDLDNYDVDYETPYSDISSKGGHPVIGSYLTCPDTQYAVPPSCNVVFPSQRTSISITNSTNVGPTRLYYNRKSQFGKLDLQSKAKGYNYDATRVGYPSIAAGLAQRAAGGAVKDLETLVFPEEFYRGPRVTITSVHPSYSSLQKFANASRFGSSGARGKVPAGTFEVDSENANEALMSVDRAASKGISSYGLYYLLAEKQYNDMRGQARTANANLIFNPYLVAGFNCALLSGDDSGMQYYGKLVSVTHSINNGGAASTSITVSSVRGIKEDLTQVINTGAITDVAPPDPIEEMRNLMQTTSGAEEFYRNLFKRGETLYDLQEQSSVEHTRANIKALRVDLEEVKELISQYDNGSERFRVFGLPETDGVSVSEIDNLISQLRSGAIKPDYSNSPLEQASKSDEIIRNMEIKKAEVFKQTYQDALIESESLSSNIKILEDYLKDSPEPKKGTRYASAFDPKQFLGWKTLNEVSYINILDTDPDTYVRQEDSEDTQVWGVPDNYRLVPLPQTSQYFKDTRKAMTYCSRPVCTLEDYIDFYNTAGRGDVGFDLNGRGRGVRGTPKTHKSGARYYDIIRSFIGGPGVQPGSIISGPASAPVDNNVSSKVQVETPSTSLQFTDYDGSLKEYKVFEPGKEATLDDLPDSRKDWQLMLLDYTRLIEGSASRREG